MSQFVLDTIKQAATAVMSTVSLLVFLMLKSGKRFCHFRKPILELEYFFSTGVSHFVSYI